MPEFTTPTSRAPRVDRRGPAVDERGTPAPSPRRVGVGGRRGTGSTVRREPAARGGAASTPLLRIRSPLGTGWRIGLGALGVLGLFAFWAVLSARLDGATSFLVPSPAATWDALRPAMVGDGTLRVDLWRRCTGVGIGYGISVAIGFVVGIAIGTFASVEAFLEPQIGFLRYIPASALTPLFLLWLGIGESPKIWLIVVGTVFYNILMMADVARAVPRELLDASYTLGAGRMTRAAPRDPPATRGRASSTSPASTSPRPG